MSESYAESPAYVHSRIGGDAETRDKRHSVIYAARALAQFIGIGERPPRISFYSRIMSRAISYSAS